MSQASSSALPALAAFLVRRQRVRLPGMRWLLAVLLLAATGFVLVVAQPRLALAWAQFAADAGERERAVWLPDYRVEIEALPLAGIADDVSGLTYDPDRGTLFAITNARPEILELSLSGEVLRRIPVSGLGDPEAIEYVGPGRYVVTDERRQALVEIRLDPATRAVDAAAARQLMIGIGRNGNKGFEGLAYDRAGDRLFVAKERDPQRIFEVRGFPQAAVIEIAEDRARDAALPGKDLSSLHFDAASGHLLALSDQSRLLVEFDTAGKPLSSLSLQAGRSGLQQAVPQAEGVAMDSRGNLYLVSEPNLFYRFSRPSAAGSAG